MEQVSHALAAMYSSGSKQDREVAAKFLESFQKSESAWSLIHEMLQSPSTSIEQRLFAAQTLRAKINYDLFQLPESSQTSLQRGLLQLLASVKEEHKAIVTQLCLCVAGLAAQMDWPNALQDVMGTLGDDEGSWRILLTFVSVLPDEVGDVRRTSLSEDELNEHMHKLLSQNGSNVLHLILRYLQSHGSNGKFTNLVFECCTSWLREWNLTEVLASPLTNFTFAALTDEAMFDAATELLCSMFNETRDVDECITSIETLYPYVAGLRPEIKKSVDNEDRFQGLTRIFCEAGEAWHVLMARMPTSMLTLVEAIADCCALDKDREVVKYSFQFWYLLKQMVTLEKFQDAKHSFQDVYTRLADTMIDLLQYPAGEDDLFDGDRESEEKFRSFRHEMGDVMKDCCAVIGSSKCLSMAFDRLHNRMAKGTWQEVEAPLFAMRAMAREVNMDEGNVLAAIMNFLVQLPEHPKVRYAATLVLGRYTEWTAQHPEYLEFQLNYITHGFESNDIELASAAAQALKHFCQDCASLLEGHLSQLHPFYTRVGQQLDLESWYEVTDGIAHVIAKQPLNQVAEYLRLFCQPIIERLLVYSATDTAEVHRKIADEVELLTIFVRVVTPYVPISEPHPCVTFWQSAWPVLSTLLQRFARVVFVSERICRFLRSMIQSYRQHTQPMLGLLAETLVSQFDSTSQGCYLWVSGAIVQVYGDAENVGNETRLAVWPFCERQSVGMFRLLNTSEPHEIPDGIVFYIVDANIQLSRISFGCPATSYNTTLLSSLHLQ